MSAQRTTDPSDTNVGFHPPAENDAPATRSMLLIILFLLVVGSLIAAVAYKHYNGNQRPAPVEQQTPPLTP